jgi:hypothetical protein
VNLQCFSVMCGLMDGCERMAKSQNQIARVVYVCRFRFVSQLLEGYPYYDVKNK